MTRFRAFLILLGLLALAAPAAATSADRMLVGFQDDPSFRWLDTRDTNTTDASRAGASIVRTTVYWNHRARPRPTVASDPFDFAQSREDLDEFVRTAAFNGTCPILAIWGTPD